MINKINLKKQYENLGKQEGPVIVAEINNTYIKLLYIKGEYIWHEHDEDELYYVVEGELTLELKGQSISMTAGDMVVIPKETEHKPIAEKGAKLMLVDPKITNRLIKVE